MCYMSERGAAPRVGVRELRQNLSVYLDRVKDGETLEVTERGRPVARLAPLPASEQSAYERLVAEGSIRPAGGDVLELGPPQRLRPGERPLSEVLAEQRDEERW
jgi:prevent-host-death family protein